MTKFVFAIFNDDLFASSHFLTFLNSLLTVFFFKVIKFSES